jgi:hypothetical protein
MPERYVEPLAAPAGHGPGLDFAAVADPTGTRLLVVAGIPASGKSQFSRKLRDRGFYYFTLNGEDDRWRTETLQIRAYQAYRRGDADALIQSLREPPGPVVIEYGFPPDPGNMAIVRAMRAAGARFVWFGWPHRRCSKQIPQAGARQRCSNGELREAGEADSRQPGGDR